MLLASSGYHSMIRSIKQWHGLTVNQLSSLASRLLATKLKCQICTKYKGKIIDRRNYSEKWLVGAESVKIFSIREHLKKRSACPVNLQW